MFAAVVEQADTRDLKSDELKVYVFCEKPRGSRLFGSNFPCAGGVLQLVTS
jgi:hypothetical protein